MYDSTYRIESGCFVASCFGQVASTIQDNWRFGINPIYIDYIDLDAVQRLACKKNDNKI